jgi:AcrR family transcriptional regulator
LSSITTKKKLLDSAIKLFNQTGVVNVRLQHISDDTIISLGNITYHFKTKDDIIHAIWLQIKEEQKILLSEFRILPLFEDIDRYLFASFQLQQKYIFFYQDILEVVRAYPAIGLEHRLHVVWQEQQMINMFIFNTARGAFVKEPYEDFYKILAGNWIWMFENWMQRQQILSKDINDYQTFSQSLWNVLMPVFTSQGFNEFNQMLLLKTKLKDEFPLYP